MFSEARYQEMPETSFISRSFVSEDSFPCLVIGSRNNNTERVEVCPSTCIHLYPSRVGRCALRKGERELGRRYTAFYK